ncbi:Ribosomal large subunit pseudouridine synthase B [Bremerella volcania]|uniref:Pseudouridine synthase n=1 Tax=Bremerella volcania TaxID=2527984 RepID=A0A518C6I4_9BACT|nr:pseudouridine synthase [Bremerella volcania]QDU74838.1 Ribosomal large subunit pseudouridine synthase B [Bremerella volcania]
MPGSSSSLVRLHKVLAEAGIGSRRKCEEIIQEGRVEVDGEFVTELGTSVDPAKQEIMVDGQRIRVRRKQYFILNKPVGVVSTNFDQAGRTRVIDLVPQDERLFTIGRLDRQSEGLIIITNDGELANHLAHPRYGVPKTYHVEVAGSVSVEEIKMIQSGVYIAEGFVKAESCRLKQKRGKSSILEIVLREGKNREIRRLLAKVGHKVLRLKRISIGPLKLGDVPAGSFRELKPSEVKALREASEAGSAKGAPKRKPAGRRTTGTSPGKTTVKKGGTTFRGGKKKKTKQKTGQSPTVNESRRGQGRAVKQKQASKKKQMRRK